MRRSLASIPSTPESAVGADFCTGNQVRLWCLPPRLGRSRFAGDKSNFLMALRRGTENQVELAAFNKFCFTRSFTILSISL